MRNLIRRISFKVGMYKQARRNKRIDNIYDRLLELEKKINNQK